MSEEGLHWFLTVDWCKQGRRGVFTSRSGQGYFRDDRAHTEEEMYEVLGPFYLVLNPKSLPFTEEDMARVREWYPLAEYSGVYGYALIPEDLLAMVEDRVKVEFPHGEFDDGKHWLGELVWDTLSRATGGQ